MATREKPLSISDKRNHLTTKYSR